MASCEAAIPLPKERSELRSFCARVNKHFLAQAAQENPDCSEALPADVIEGLVKEVGPLLKEEGLFKELVPGKDVREIIVVGDTHGQWTDFYEKIFEQFGYPTLDTIYIFNGDYVDRGPGSLEILVVLMVAKLFYPNNIILLRGNHETTGTYEEAPEVTEEMVFSKELRLKYGQEKGMLLYNIFTELLFPCLPCAMTVAGTVFIAHGGLFRSPDSMPGDDWHKMRGEGEERRAAQNNAVGAAQVGTISALRTAFKRVSKPSSKPITDPDWLANSSAASRMISDLLWGDPTRHQDLQGLHPNRTRGCSIYFGVMAIQEFMVKNGFWLWLRAHEAQDARLKAGRLEPGEHHMGSMELGYSVDYKDEEGRTLITQFSAPNYPWRKTHYGNAGAIIKLTGPQWHEAYEIVTFQAAEPRPEVAWWHSKEDDKLAAQEEQEQEEEEEEEEQQQEGKGEEGAAGVPEALPAAALAPAAPAEEPGSSAEAAAAAAAGMAALAVTGSAAEVATPASSKRQRRPAKTEPSLPSPSDVKSLRRSERNLANKAKMAQ